MSDPHDASGPERPVPPPRPYWPAPSEPLGPPQEQIPGPEAAWAPPQYGPPPPQYGSWNGDRPANNLRWALLSLLLFWPLGLAAVYYATRVNIRWAQGDPAGARDAADRARKFAIASAVLGVLAAALLLATGGADT